MVKRELPAEKTLYSTCMQHDMPQSLLVFALSFTPGTPKFVTFGGVVHPLEESLIVFKCLLLKCVYTHI